MSDHNPRLLLGYWYGFSFPEQKPAVAWEGHVRYADITYVINRIGSFQIVSDLSIEDEYQIHQLENLVHFPIQYYICNRIDKYGVNDQRPDQIDGFRQMMKPQIIFDDIITNSAVFNTGLLKKGSSLPDHVCNTYLVHTGQYLSRHARESVTQIYLQLRYYCIYQNTYCTCI